jgi:DNA-binding transcriptional ArsR family regulator
LRVTGEVKGRILSSLADPESTRIIEAVTDRPLSAMDLEKKLGLPLSTLYRKITSLRECGLLMVDSFALTPDGKREALYSCTYTEIRVEAVGGGIEVFESPRSKERKWFELFFGGSATKSAESPSTAS